MKITMGIRVNFQTISRRAVGYVLIKISSSNIFLYIALSILIIEYNN